MAAADERDAVSDTRDAASEKRSNDADLAEMLDPKSEYGAHWPERRHAAATEAREGRPYGSRATDAMTEGPEDQDSDLA